MSSTPKQTWYEVRRYGRYNNAFGEGWIIPIVVVKETEKTVTIEEFHSQTNWSRAHITTCRRNKDSDLWRTKVEAEAEVTRRLSENIRQAQERLDRAKAEFEKWFLRQ